MKWGWMGDYGLILNQDGDLSFRQVFKYLPGLNNYIKFKFDLNYQNIEISDFSVYFYIFSIYKLPIYRLGRSVC